ncbi:uncharacterized protein LOC115217280 [Argonauta hians]
MGSLFSCSVKQKRHLGSMGSPSLLPLDNLAHKPYPFENLVFEGCDMKGYSYVGAIKVLELVGILPKIKRFAGMGSGAIVACLLAAGFDSVFIQDALDMFFEKLFVHSHHSKKVRQDDIMLAFGFNSGRKFYQWFGQLLMRQFDDPDITFQQLYDLTNKELCIPVMNLNHLRADYFHPKTTPDFPIRRSVFLAISVPGIYQPLKFSLDESPADYYLNGGLICNFPIHCFDGWWLSMESDDNFLYKCQPTLDMRTLHLESFSEFNPATLGIMTFDDYHTDEVFELLKLRLDRTGSNIPIPETKLGKKYYEAKEKLDSMKGRMESFPRYSDKLNAILERLQENGCVNVKDLVSELLNPNKFSADEIKTLFGIGNKRKECIDFFNRHTQIKNKIPIPEIVSIVEKRHWQNFYLLTQLSPTSSSADLSMYWASILNASHERNKYISEMNANRIIAIYTGYVGNTDIGLDDADALYLYQHGWNSTVAFLQEHLRITTMPGFQVTTSRTEWL